MKPTSVFQVLMLLAGLCASVSAYAQETSENEALKKAEARALRSIEWFRREFPDDRAFKEVAPPHYSSSRLFQHDVEETALPKKN